MNNEKAKNANWRGEKLRVENTETTKCQKFYEIGLEDFMKLLEVKVHYHEIEVWHMSSWSRRIMN